MTIVGTRPEIIRLARVIARLDALPGVEHILVHTGQNYDRQLNEVFFEELEIREPDHYLAVDTSSLGAVLGDVLKKTEDVLVKERPDAVLVLGDTNSCLATIMAKRLRVPTYHMEAGNRSFDENVPEEINRRLIDHVADFNIAYTDHARRNLLAEGLHPRRILVCGSPMREVLDRYREGIQESNVLARLGLDSGQYFLVSAHREENVDSPERLRALLECLRRVYAEHGLPIVVSTHPRTRKRLEALGEHVDGDIRWLEPFGFFDYNHLQVNASCVLSDSGTISEEAAILGFSAITLRESIERPEALDAGSIMMTGLDPTDVIRALAVMSGAEPVSLPEGYDVTDTSSRVVRFMLSTISRNAAWSGIREVSRDA